MHIITVTETDENGQTGNGMCTVTAIGPHAVMTAEHCDGSGTVQIDKQDAQVEGTLLDGNDHEILLLRGITFKDYLSVSLGPVYQGEHVHLYGNPLDIDGMTNMYREGYVMGEHSVDDKEAIIMNLLAAGGDSGSAILNDQGQVITLVTGGYGPVVVYSYPLAFSPDQLNKARAYEGNSSRPVGTA